MIGLERVESIFIRSYICTRKQVFTTLRVQIKKANLTGQFIEAVLFQDITKPQLGLEFRTFSALKF